MTVQYLISTVNGKVFRPNKGLLKKLDNALVINQVDEDVESVDSDPYLVFTCRDKGLSKSRNAAIEKATGDICYICDDDLDFVDNADTVIVNEFNENPTADIIIFPVTYSDSDQQRRRGKSFFYPMELFLCGVISFEIAFRLKSVREAGIRFDERFGLGATYKKGEENIFLIDCHRKGLTIHLSEKSVALHPFINSGMVYNNDKSIMDSGAMLARNFGKRAKPLGVLFALKSYPLYRKHYSLRKAVYLIWKGMDDFNSSIPAHL